LANRAKFGLARFLTIKRMLYSMVVQTKIFAKKWKEKKRKEERKKEKIEEKKYDCTEKIFAI
jgi:hypothetical protein